jgi:hypothetical protein
METTTNAVKFTQEELDKFKELERKYQESIFKFGQLHLEVLDAREFLKNLENSEDDLQKGYLSIVKEEQDFLTKLTDKYGEGQLSLKDGTFIPSKK